jgi:hypothetical protein
LAFLEGGFILEVDQGHCPSLSKVSAQTDKKHRAESKNRKTKKAKKALFRGQLLKTPSQTALFFPYGF